MAQCGDRITRMGTGHQTSCDLPDRIITQGNVYSNITSCLQHMYNYHLPSDIKSKWQVSSPTQALSSRAICEALADNTLRESDRGHGGR